ncbi:MAG: caspase family protein [Lewinellaceae bacterium]|nr:caspase family protein [Lewinellaceae bacterium]
MKPKIYILFSFLFFFMVGARGQKPELVVQTGHKENVNSVAFSPDGQYVLTGSADRTAKLWDLYGQELQTFIGHGAGVHGVAFSPDGQKIVTAARDASVKVWNLAGEVLYSFDFEEYEGLDRRFDGAHSVAFFPDGKKVLIADSRNNIWIWAFEENKRDKFFAGDKLWQAKLSPDGKFILASNSIGNYSYQITLWNSDGEKLFILPGASLPFEFSPDGERILTGSQNKGVYLWSISGGLLENYSAQVSGPGFLLFSPDGEGLVLSASAEGRYAVLNLTKHSSIQFDDRVESVTDMDISPDGQFILLGGRGDKNGTLWSLDGDLVTEFKGEGPVGVNSVCLTPDDEALFAGCMDGAIRKWALNLGRRGTNILNGHQGRVHAIDISPDGKKMISGGEGHTAILWDISGKEIGRFLSDHEINSVEFSSDGKQFLIGEYDGGVTVWEMGATVKRRFALPASPVWATCFSPQNKIFTNEGDNLVLWSEDGKFIQNYYGTLRPVISIACSPDGNRIAAGNMDGVALLWESGQQEHIIGFRHKDPVNFVGFSPDSRLLLAGSQDGKANLWSLGEKVISLDGHSSMFTSGCFTKDGRSVFTSSEDGTIKLWDASTGSLIATFLSFRKDNNWMIISADGYYAGSKKISGLAHFRVGKQLFNFSQFDLRLNRPDKILETLALSGKDSLLIAQYRNAYYKRLKKYDFTEDMLSEGFHIPKCTITGRKNFPYKVETSHVTLNIEASDSLYLLDRLNIYINNVPLYGIAGIGLRPLNTYRYTATVSLPLSRGPNKIQVSALNQGGAESLKATTYITYDAPETKPNLYLITIGVSDYQAEGLDLQYAAKDARDIAEWYRSAPGFGQVYTKTLTDGQVTKANIFALRQWLEGTSVDDEVLLFVSGHGLLDKNYDFYYGTHDIDFANPAEKGIRYDDIEGLLDGIPARKKLLLMDACHSGEYDKDTPPLTSAQRDSLEKKGVTFKGFAKGKPILGLQSSFEMMQQLFADLRRGSGATVITSSSGVQVSYEDEEWANGAFTYAFLYGLKTMKADANEDGQVTASEIQAFVGEYVPRLTEGLQVPTFRRENLEFDFRVW